MDFLAKVYDLLLLNNLTSWMSNEKCQVGGQSGHGCIERIMSLRLLCDYALYEKVRLYVFFIYLSKAYDKVSR